MGKWVIGLDTLSRHRGAVSFASWWQRACKSAAPEFVGLHVHRPYELPASTEGSTLEWLRAEARDPSFDDVREALPGAAVRTTEATNIAQTLEAEVDRIGGSGIIIGRKAKAEQASAIRLGGVARRMLRRLHQPVSVVPPDWNEDAHASGPVLLATDLKDDSLGALAFAKSFASACGRDLVAVHVSRDVGRYFHYARSDARFDTLRQRVLDDLDTRTRAWLDEHDAKDAKVLAVLGDAAERVLHMAVEHDAVAVICGSRGLSVPERMLQASVGSTVAAFANCPVTIVAPGSSD